VTDGPQEGEGNSFWNRLRRRKVVQWGIVYAAGAWGLLQGLEYVTSTFDWPRQIQQFATLGLLIGLPVVLVTAWYHGDQGRQRVSAAELTIIALLFLLGGGIFWRYDKASDAPSPATAPGAAVQTTEQAAVAKVDAASIAVLPFADLSQAGDQGYFSDGMAEEILNVLAKVKGLQVASRTSSFAFKDQEDLGIPAIAQQLGVRHVLEGSVRRAGGTIRITAQLIDADVDRHLWSETFDRPLTAENVFAIQDEIAKAIVAALVKALPAAKVGAVGRTATTTDLGAYDNYLQARALVRSRHELLLADQLVEKSLQQDSKYAPAWELRAALQSLLSEYTDTPLSAEDLDRRGTEYADRALSLDPDSALALAVKANLRANAVQELRGRHDLADVIADLERSVKLDPNSVNALNWLGRARLLVGQPDKGLEAFQRCVQVDPLAAACSENESRVLTALGRYDEAWRRQLAALDRGAKIDQLADFPLLAHMGQKAAFMFASNQSRYLPRWHRHEALYEAYRNPEADHGELAREILAFAGKERLTSRDYLVGLLLPLGAYDLTPDLWMLWGEDNRRYRQSPQFKSYIRESGIHDYWRKAGFPEQCQPVGSDDFRCD
jgi:TolB-like protein/Tfp pilus assembly protein PilF